MSNLEIVSPQAGHESAASALRSMVDILAEELDLEWASFGSLTLKRVDVEHGAEPDACFYFTHEAAVRGTSTIDLAEDPPPELVVEVDITNPPLPRLPIYAPFGVAEIWRYDGRDIRLYRLDGDVHSERDRSRIFPWIEADNLTATLEDVRLEGHRAALRAFREWVRTRAADLDQE